MVHAQPTRAEPGPAGPGPAYAPAIVHQTVETPGEPLAGPVRRPLEDRLQHDFGQVRIHRDPLAAAAAAAIGARAFTVGRHVVFGAGEYAPGTPRGRAVLAHELAHAAQQRATGRADAPLPLAPRGDARERQASAWSGAALMPPAALRAPAPVLPLHDQLVQRLELTESVIALLPDEYEQPVRDLRDSVLGSWQYAFEFFTDDLLVTLEENWPQILAVTIAFVAAEEIIAILSAAPTGVSQLVAAIMQIIVLAILGAFVVLEVAAAVQAGVEWIELARTANGDPAKVAEASRAFVRMIWHIVMVAVAAAGVKVKVKGMKTTTGAPAPPPPTGGAAGAGGGAEVVDLASRAGFRPAGQPAPAPTPTAPMASASEVEVVGNVLRKKPQPMPTPAPEPLPAPPTPKPTPAPTPQKPTVRTPRTFTVGTGAAIGTESAPKPGPREEPEEEPKDDLVYRSMNDAGGRPQIAQTAAGLGVRDSDVTLLPGNIVEPDGKGMSMARFTPMNLPAFRRPPEWGGTGRAPVWAISPGAFQSPLRFNPDSPTHAAAAAAHKLPIDDMRKALAATQSFWIPWPRAAGP